jgi:hypothetical protein
MKLPFDTLHYHCGPCFGPCSVYHLKIHGDGTLKLHRELVFVPDTFDHDRHQEGFFSGTLSESQSQQLRAALDAFLSSDTSDPAEGIHITDIQEHIIHIEMGGQKLHFTYKLLPEGINDLLAVLGEICEKGSWERIEESEYKRS